MGKLLVKTSFSGYSDYQLDTDGNIILSKMKDNTSFPAPDPAYAVVESAWKDFSGSLVKASSGDREAIAEKNAFKEVFTLMLQRWAFYVNQQAVGDMKALLSSGFTVAKEASFRELQPPTNFMVTTTGRGAVALYAGSVPGANSFIYQYTQDPITDSSVWVSEGSTTRRYTFQKLVPGSKLWFRVVAIGSYKQQATSMAIDAFVS